NFSKAYKIIYKKFERNLGSHSLTKQWERCINLTEGEKWIMVLCDDDYISENYIEEFYKNLKRIERLEINVVRFASRIVREENNSISDLFTHPVIEDSTDSLFRRYFKFSRSSLSEY